MKLIQISDLHFGMNKEELIEPFLNSLKRIQPDLIVISGDLTQRATKEQYGLFTNFVKKLPGIILIVPGNHDIPLYPHQLFIRMFSPFKYYKRYVHSELTTQFENDEVRILGVNSVNPYRVTKGRLSEDTMQKIETYFSKPFSGLNILFFHHNFDLMEGTHKPLENYEEFINYLRKSPINIVCAGHSHYANINLIEKYNKQSCVFLHAGSLLCTRTKDGFNSYYQLENINELCHITCHTVQNNEFIILSKYQFNLSKELSQNPLIPE